MTTLPDLEPLDENGIDAAVVAIGEYCDQTSPAVRYARVAIRAYLAAARSTVPEAGKAVDETAQDIIASTYIDGRNEPIGRLHALAILTHLEAAGYRVLASVPAPSGAEPSEQTCPSCGGNGVNPEGIMRPDGGLADCEICNGRGTISSPQAVPAEDVAGLVERLSALDDDVTYGHDAVKINADILCLIREAAAALTASEAEATSLRRKLEEHRTALEHVRAIISEGAMVGFNPLDGTWAERLYASQGMTHAVLNPARGASE